VSDSAGTCCPPGTIYRNDASNSLDCCQSNNIIEGKCCESGDDLLNENGECCNANTEQPRTIMKVAVYSS
jgi:hypothetical protein